MLGSILTTGTTQGTGAIPAAVQGQIVELLKPPFCLVVVALIALGYFLKYGVHDGGDNSAIPRILLAVSLLVTPLLGYNRVDTLAQDCGCACPAFLAMAGKVIICLLLGVIYWAMAWASHKAVMKRIENLFIQEEEPEQQNQTSPANADGQRVQLEADDISVDKR